MYQRDTMIIIGRTLWRAPLLALAAMACAQQKPQVAAYPRGPGLLEGRPPQRIGSYRIVGWVLSDNTGLPVRGAMVYAESTRVRASSDEFGRFVLEDVPPGQYTTVVVARIGYEGARRTFTQKAPGGISTVGVKWTFSDTLNFWLHAVR